jgi:hypothetical protein
MPVEVRWGHAERGAPSATKKAAAKRRRASQTAALTTMRRRDCLAACAAARRSEKAGHTESTQASCSSRARARCGEN